MVRRQRLLNSLGQGLLNRFTIVLAPAGYGKTTALAEFARSLKFPVAWASLDPGDRDVRALLRLLVQSVRQTHPAVGRRLLDRLHGDGAFGLDHREAAVALLGELESVPDYLVLIVDDFHAVAGSTTITSFFERVVAELPANLHLIVASRSWPLIPSLRRMIANQMGTVVTARNLAFSMAETTELLDQFGLRVGPEAVKRLVALTDGWPAAVVMLAGQVNQLDTASWDVSGREDLFRYIADEILAKLPEDLQEFSLATSILDEIDPDVCNELLGRSDSSEILERLLDLNLPLARLEGEHPVYRYHSLVQDFLRRKARYGDRKARRRLHEDAATVYARKRQWNRSVHHWSQIEHWDVIAAIIDEIGEATLASGQWRELASWIDVLPREVVAERARLGLLRAKAAYLLQDPDTCLRLVADLKKRLKQSDVELLAQSHALRGAALTLKGQYDQAIRSCEEALRLVEAQAGCENVEADALKNFAIALGMRGNYIEAIERCEAALVRYSSIGNADEEGTCHLQLGVAHWHLSRLDETIYHLQTAVDIFSRLGRRHLAVRALNNLGVAFHWQGNLIQAKKTLKRAINLSRRIGVKSTEGYALVSLADVQRDLSNYRESADLYDAGLAIARSLGDGLLTLSTQVGLAEVYRHRGDLERCEELAKQALLEAQRHGNPREIALCLSTLAVVHKDGGDLEVSLSNSTRAAELFADVGAKFDTARALFSVASALYALRRRTQSLRVLERVAELVKELGDDHFLMADAARDPALVEYAAAKKIGSGVFARVFRRVVHRGGPSRHSQRPGKQLPMVSVRSLGHFEAFLNGVRVHDVTWQTSKAKEMFLYILLNNRRVHKDALTAALWPDIEPAKVNSAFHGTLHRLRKATYGAMIVYRGGWYELNRAGSFWSDVEEFRSKIASATQLGPGATEMLNDAITLYRGALVPAWYSEWLAPVRVELEDLYLKALSTLMSEATLRNDYQASISLAERILQINAYDVDAWRVLIQTRLTQHEPGPALRLYRRCKDVFRTELQMEIPEDITALTDELIA